LSNRCNLSPIILSIFIVILLVLNTTLSGIPSTIFFQNGVNEVTQNNLMTSYVFASPDEEADDSNNSNNEDAGEDSQGLSDEEADDSNNSNNEDAGEDSQGLQDIVRNITTVNPSLTGLSEPPQNEQCPAGSPPGCYVKPSSPTARESCPAGEMVLKKVPGGPEGTMCALIEPIQNQENPSNPMGVKETLSNNNIQTLDESNSETTVTKSSPASCNSQGTLFDPATNMCKNPQSIQDCAKVMQRYDPNQGKCIRFFP
jgi:hypothetical protein